ncbi:hypothetical protein L244_31825, partial [Salmonella enterica subsp. enterica serovar Worthington str. BCH-3194]
MNMDALTAIENFASSIFSAGMDFLFTWGEFIGVISMITLFARARSAGPVKMSPGKFIAGSDTSMQLVNIPAINFPGDIFTGPAERARANRVIMLITPMNSPQVNRKSIPA